MKLHASSAAVLLVQACLFPVSLQAQSPQSFPYGITLGNPADTYIDSWNAGGGRTSSEFTSVSGGIVLYTEMQETSPGLLDGGITFYGSPISVVPYSAPSYNSGTFDVWRVTEYGAPAGEPAFRIDTGSNNVTFKGLNVAVTGGSLSIGGSLALTLSSAPSYLESQGYVVESDFQQLLLDSVPPINGPWRAAFVSQGNVEPLVNQTIGGYLALGTSVASGQQAIAAGAGVTASGMHSMATGAGTTTASGAYSRAHGYSSLASALYSSASGNTAKATGFYSFSNGWGTSAKSSNEVAFGRFNLESLPYQFAIAQDGQDGLFRLGNGSATVRSDAMTVLKSGQTTLINKEWKSVTVANPGSREAALADPLPGSLKDSDGNALVVDGHTVLNGRVTISVPQGDISMGIYGN